MPHTASLTGRCQVLAESRLAARQRRPRPQPSAVTTPSRAQGQHTARQLLSAGLAEFAERGFHAATVDDIVRRAHTSHGTFYMYFANKNDLFGVLSDGALHAMESIADEFPVVTPDRAGRAAVRKWVGSFCDTYAAHATVIRILSQADLVGQDAWESGLRVFLRLAEVVTIGMTAGLEGAGAARTPVAVTHLDAVACLMMLERVNYLLSAGLKVPRAELADRLTAIIIAAFHATGCRPETAPPPLAGPVR